MPSIRSWKVLLPVAIIAIGAGFFFTRGEEEVPTAPEEEIIQDVELIPAVEILKDTAILTTLGSVQSIQDVDIRAETAGQVVQVNVKEGDTVQAGQVLLSLERQILDAQLFQAEARLSSAQAALNKLRNGERPEDVEILQQRLNAERERLKEMEKGARPEELTISQTQLENAQKSLVDSQKDLENTIEKADRDILTVSEAGLTLMGTVASGMEKILQQNLQDIIYPVRFPTNETCELRIVSFASNSISEECFRALRNSEEQRSAVQNTESQTPTPESTIVLLEETLTRLEHLRTFLDLNLQQVSGTIANLESSTTITDQELTNLKTLVTTAQSENNALITQVNTQIQTIKNQLVTNQNAITAAETRVTQSENAVLNAENDLTLKRAGSTPEQIAIQESQIRQLELQVQIAEQGARAEDIQSQQASVQQAQADVSVARANRDKAIIIAPITGTIIDFPYDIGDYISTNEIVASIANRDQLEVITYITEKERQLVRVGAQVSVLDTDVTGTVRSISPALERDTKKIKVTILLDEVADQLVIGQTVFTGFELTLPEGSIRIPLDTVLVEDRVARVLSVNEFMKVISFQVEPGEIIEDTIVISGLNPQIPIIPNPQDLEVGQTVQTTLPVTNAASPEPATTEVPPQLSPA